MENKKNLAEWKKRLNDILKEHPDVGNNMTGRVEVHCNVGGITKVYIYKEIK